MKKNARPIYFALMVSVATFINVSGLSAQEKINVTAGIGFPDWVNAGIRYRTGQVLIGASAGFLPVSGESITTFSLDLLYHFAGSSSKSDLRPWYGRAALAYFHDRMEGSFNEKFIFLGTRAGREFNLSENFGIYADAGLMFKLYSEKEENPDKKLIFDLFWAFPAGGAGFFWRF